MEPGSQTGMHSSEDKLLKKGDRVRLKGVGPIGTVESPLLRFWVQWDDGLRTHEPIELLMRLDKTDAAD